MPEIPDSLQTLFTATVEQQGGTYQIQIPTSEVESGPIGDGKRYRVAILDQPENPSGRPADRQSPAPGELQDKAHSRPPGTSSTQGADQSGDPSGDRHAPVDEGDVVNVEIEEVGDQGDGLAKVDGFAVFVPSGEPGDKLTVEIESVRRTVAHASALQGRRSATE